MLAAAYAAFDTRALADEVLTLGVEGAPPEDPGARRLVFGSDGRAIELVIRPVDGSFLVAVSSGVAAVSVELCGPAAGVRLVQPGPCPVSFAGVPAGLVTAIVCAPAVATSPGAADSSGAPRVVRHRTAWVRL